jgi:WXG100 family type VII secretion target
MAEFSVNPQALASKKEQLQNLNEQLKAKRSELEAANNNLSGMWEGEARTAFEQAIRTDLSKIDEFIRLIQQYCTALDEIISKYVSAETRNTDTAVTRTY